MEPKAFVASNSHAIASLKQFLLSQAIIIGSLETSKLSFIPTFGIELAFYYFLEYAYIAHKIKVSCINLKQQNQHMIVGTSISH